MKIFIGLALLSVAFAIPFEPIELPEAPQPDVEMSIELPKPEMPAFEMPDFRPLIIPEHVMEALFAAAAQMNFDVPASAVRFVDNAEDVSPNEVVPVSFVEVAEDNAAEESLDLTPVEDAPVYGDAIIVVDQAVPENVVGIADGEPVHFVDVANNVEYDSFDSSNVAMEESAIDASNIIPDAVRFVDAPMMADSEAVPEQYSVKVVDTPIYMGKVYDNPMLRNF